MSPNHFLVPPPHQVFQRQQSETQLDAFNGTSRRQFIKKSGCATVVTLAAWNATNLVATGDGEEGQGSSWGMICTQPEPSATPMVWGPLAYSIPQASGGAIPVQLLLTVTTTKVKDPSPPDPTPYNSSQFQSTAKFEVKQISSETGQWQSIITRTFTHSFSLFCDPSNGIIYGGCAVSPPNCDQAVGVAIGSTQCQVQIIRKGPWVKGGNPPVDITQGASLTTVAGAKMYIGWDTGSSSGGDTFPSSFDIQISNLHVRKQR